MQAVQYDLQSTYGGVILFLMKFIAVENKEALIWSISKLISTHIAVICFQMKAAVFASSIKGMMVSIFRIKAKKHRCQADHLKSAVYMYCKVTKLGEVL